MFQRVGTIYWPVSGSRDNVSRCHAASRGSSPSPSPPPPPCRARCGFLSGQRETNAWFGLAAWCRACRLVRPTKTNILECTHRGSVARIGHLEPGQGLAASPTHSTPPACWVPIFYICHPCIGVQCMMTRAIPAAAPSHAVTTEELRAGRRYTAVITPG